MNTTNQPKHCCVAIQCRSWADLYRNLELFPQMGLLSFKHITQHSEMVPPYFQVHGNIFVTSCISLLIRV